jgi:gamma-glutamylcyclotransferase (GGCT)/AIG2-like uncharacterized protein YtfP
MFPKRNVYETFGERVKSEFMTCPRVLVYGTLRAGMGNHATFLEGAIPLGEFRIPGFVMWTQNSSYIPYVTESSDEFEIDVEGYEVKALEDFIRLDYLEGHPNFYTRIMIEHRGISYWIYTIPKNKAIKLFEGNEFINRIQSGNYVQWYLRDRNRHDH